MTTPDHMIQFVARSVKWATPNSSLFDTRMVHKYEVIRNAAIETNLDIIIIILLYATLYILRKSLGRMVLGSTSIITSGDCHIILKQTSYPAMSDPAAL